MATFTRPGTVIRVHDGDTAVIDIDLGKHCRRARADEDLGWHLRRRADGHLELRTAVRVDGLAAPELRKDGAPNPAGEASRDYAEHLLPPGTAVTVVSKALWGSFEKYGRVLADLTLPSGQSFAAVMIAAGHGVAWNGAGKQPDG